MGLGTIGASLGYLFGESYLSARRLLPMSYLGIWDSPAGPGSLA